MKLDEIGFWSEIKLDILRKYAQTYSTILTSKGLYHVYIDAFAGAGIHISKRTRELIAGSPKIALDVLPPFDEYFFIDIDGSRVSELKKLAGGRKNVHIFQGDCNEILLKEVFPHLEYERFRRGLCLLDPYGLHLDWRLIETAGKMRTIDMFLNFPVADMNRNVLWRISAEVDEADIKRMNTYWGDESWKGIAYSKMKDLFGEVEVKEPNRIIAKAFRRRLLEFAEFQHVTKPLPMRNSRGAIVYYLFFASQQQLADKIIKDIFKKYTV